VMLLETGPTIGEIKNISTIDIGLIVLIIAFLSKQNI